MRLLLIAVAVAAAASAASAANAESPEAVEIQAHPTQFCCPELGPWTMSGAVTDSGTFERTEGATSPPDRPPFALGPFREVFVFTGALGTFTIKTEERATEDGVTGVWQIVSGTGAYEDASGHGTVAFSASPGLFTLSLTGVIKKVG